MVQVPEQVIGPGAAHPSLRSETAQFAALLDGTEFTDAHGDRLDVEKACAAAIAWLENIEQHHGTVFLVGNGGSAAVASHVVNDLCNSARLRSLTVHDPSLLTCFTNDYGHDLAYGRILARVARPRDGLIAISSSGNSRNIHEAVRSIRQLGGTVITLSGFSPDNALRTLGDLNIHVGSHAYGMVEVAHLFILHYFADRYRAEHPHERE